MDLNSIHQNICLIGGTGFLGSSFRYLYSKKFTKVFIFGRNTEPPSLNDNEVYLSIAAIGANEIVELLQREKINSVIDFAYSSIPKTSFENPVEDFSENLLLVIKHLEIIKKVRTCRYIYISSGGTVYGNTDNHPINEYQQNFPLSPYGITKMACERYINMYHHVYGLEVVIVRPSNIYGPGQRPFRGQGFIATAMACANISERVNVFGNGSNVRDYLYIDDFCAGLLDILQFGQTGEIYNVGSSDGKSLNEIILIINQVINHTDKQLLVNYLPSRRFDVQYNVLDNAKMASLHSWKVNTYLHIGLNNTWKWILNNM